MSGSEVIGVESGDGERLVGERLGIVLQVGKDLRSHDGGSEEEEEEEDDEER